MEQLQLACKVKCTTHFIKKSNWLERIRVKNHQADAARDDGAKRAFNILLYIQLGYPLVHKPHLKSKPKSSYLNATSFASLDGLHV